MQYLKGQAVVIDRRGEPSCATIIGMNSSGRYIIETWPKVNNLRDGHRMSITEDDIVTTQLECTYDPVVFPHVTHLDQLFTLCEKHQGYYLCNGWRFVEEFKGAVQPLPYVREYVSEYMLNGLGIHFELVDRGETVLVLVKYDQIIGSRYLAIIPRTGVEEFLRGDHA